MPRHPFDPPRGRVELIEVGSGRLANVVGDPERRSVAVYLPEGYDRGGDDYPLLCGLAGFTGSGLKLLGWRSFGESLPQRLDRLVAQERMGPVVCVLPDGFTSLGGNQYVNSSALGLWEDFLLEDVLPQIERRYRVRPGPRHRAVFGKSSGGYGALIQALKHGDRWAAVACHSGDLYFDLLYRRDLPVVADELARHDRSVVRFVDTLRESPKIRGSQMHVLMLLAMAASYDPDPEAAYGIRLPMDPETCELDPERWQRWLEHDPLLLIERPPCQESLRALRLLYLDCGRRDQYFLHFGARAFVRRLTSLGIANRYEEFDDDHSSVDYRMDVSLPLLYEAVAGN